MKKSTRAALRTARSLLAKGLLGRDLQAALSDTHPTLTPNQRTVVGKVLRKEVGVLGQVAHDPNLFNNCRQAAKAKEEHPHVHTLIATYRTPMCASCAYNRKGSCALMGGKLIAGADGVDEKIVDRTASILVEEGALPEAEAQRIATSSLPAGKRAAALHLRKSLPLVDNAADTRAVQSSRRIGAMLQNDTTIHIEPARLTGPRTARNLENGDTNTLLETQPGDERVSRRAASFDRVLRAADLDIEVPGEPMAPRRDVRMASRSVFDVPEMNTGGHRSASAVDEEHMTHVQTEHDKLIRKASRLLASGSVDTETATQFTHHLDTLRQHGAIASRRASRITTQLSALSGALEI